MLTHHLKRILLLAGLATMLCQVAMHNSKDFFDFLEDSVVLDQVSFHFHYLIGHKIIILIDDITYTDC